MDKKKNDKAAKALAAIINATDISGQTAVSMEMIQPPQIREELQYKNPEKTGENPLHKKLKREVSQLNANNEIEKKKNADKLKEQIKKKNNEMASAKKKEPNKEIKKSSLQKKMDKVQNSPKIKSNDRKKPESEVKKAISKDSPKKPEAPKPKKVEIKKKSK
ncbi:hypothetical protein V1387_04835 [Allomuricauda taeanensis]|uniref:hypothetical protein n=1 Tax=Flagellimonas taeanensis TaxID=1005926 RepID=UPI002E7BBA4B|nr:hypothetical protein [Allomuricauda taeanensis]MEE1962001.1 hypothetical protein [Allomuricauda taeanensis]